MIHGFGGMSGFGGWGIFNSIFMLAFWILIIVGIVFLIKYLVSQSGSGSQKTSDENLLEILKRRYAKGEITREEFEKMKKELSD
jgi:putative membrane protein